MTRGCSMSFWQWYNFVLNAMSFWQWWMCPLHGSHVLWRESAPLCMALLLLFFLSIDSPFDIKDFLWQVVSKHLSSRLVTWDSFLLAGFFQWKSSLLIMIFLFAHSRYCWCQASCLCPFSGVQNLLRPWLCICAACARATDTFCYPLSPHSVIMFLQFTGITSPPRAGRGQAT